MSTKIKQPRKWRNGHHILFAAKPFIDYDYRHKLDPNTRAFLDKFTKEFYLDSFAKVLPLHKKRIEKRALYTRTRERRRAVLLHSCESIATYSKPLSTPSPEDALIEAIDLMRENKAS